MKLSLSEETYSKEFYKAYNTYGNNIPDVEWQRLGELRSKYGIDMSRVREIINAVQEGTIVPSIGQADKKKPAAGTFILTGAVRNVDCDDRVISHTPKSEKYDQEYIPVPIKNLTTQEDEEDCEVENYEDIPTKDLQFMVEECDGRACIELSKRYAHGTTLLERDKERSKELRKLGMLYLYGSTISPEFEEGKDTYKSVFLAENGKPYVDWQTKSQQMKKLFEDLGTFTKRYSDLASNFDTIQHKLSNLVRPEEVKEAPKFFTTWIKIGLAISLLSAIINLYLGVILTVMLLAERYDYIRKKKKEHYNYSWDLHHYKKDKSKLTIEYAKEKRVVTSAFTYVQNALYDGLNVGLGIPFNKNIIKKDTYTVFLEGLKKLFYLNDKAMNESDPARKRVADKRFYDAKLRFFYTYSFRAETELDEVYNYYQDNIHKSVSAGDTNILRKDDLSFIKQNNAEMSQNLSDIKGLLDDNRLADVMDELGYLKDQDISSYGGLWTDETKLVEKSNELRKLYEIAKDEYEELTDSNEKINYWLDYVRACAYRNTYLGVELINIFRNNAGGRTLVTQKDGIDVSIQSFDVQEVTINNATVDLDAHINNTINSFTNALMNKQNRKWMKKNPKLTMGAAALTFVGGALLDKLDKHTQLISEHSEFQKEIISNIKKMTDGYEEGKASSLRAIEIIKAIAKANKGFMAVYEPLREKYLENGEDLTMQDMHAIAKATQDYKNISDSKLNK